MDSLDGWSVLAYFMNYAITSNGTDCLAREQLAQTALASRQVDGLLPLGARRDVGWGAC